MGKIQDIEREIQIVEEERQKKLSEWRKVVGKYRALTKKKKELSKQLTKERNLELSEMVDNYDIQVGDQFEITRNTRGRSRNYPIGIKFKINSVSEKSFGLEWTDNGTRSADYFNNSIKRIPKERLFRIITNNTDDDVQVRRELRLGKLLE